jgi:pimeloyl-ACP methyl ester carboxylesterase
MYPARPGIAHAQADSLSEANTIHPGGSSVSNICEDTAAPPPLKDALRLVCQRKPVPITNVAARNLIVIGFVGGFVKHDDTMHPEVHFATYLRDRYPSAVHAEVFANHDGKKALRQVLRLLDTNGDGMLAPTEKEQASIIIYGHSWGASQAVALARELGRQAIPVLLTIQVDSIRKRGQDDSTIPANTRTAVNFYQLRGLLHGRSTIRAADLARTKILGNFRMTYEDRRINCDNYPWLVRVFDKPHHEIENDPRVWDQITALIDFELTRTRSTTQVSSPSSLSPK